MNDELQNLVVSKAVQDQEWAKAVDWIRDPDNQDAVLRLAYAAVAKDAMVLVAIMQDDPRYAEVIQRLMCLALVEALVRKSERGIDSDPAQPEEPTP